MKTPRVVTLAFLCVIVGYSPSGQRAIEAPSARILTATEATAISDQLANDKSSKSFGHVIFVKQVQARLVDGHWEWWGAAFDGHHGTYEVTVRLAFDDSTNSVEGHVGDL
jgi:hypothetical protein